MDEIERLGAIEVIRRVKARYFRGVDLGDAALVRSILAEDCVLDYRGCCTDPVSGRDFLPGMNVVLRGRAAFGSGLKGAGIVSVHHGHDADIEIIDATNATAIWAMTDRLVMPAGAAFAEMIGHGFYHETYAKSDGMWRIKTLRLSRVRVDVR